MLSTWRTCCLGVSQRWIFAVMAFFGLWIGNGLRVILSITITQMVLPVEDVATQMDDICTGYEMLVPKNDTIILNKVYDWDEYTQGIILSSYFWGYATSQFPFGALSERFGGKHLFGFSILIPAILTSLTPVAIDQGGYIALIVLRILMGITSGAMYPAASTLISHWAAPAERTKIGSIIFAGAILGTVFGTTMPAIIISYSGLDWSAVFYFFGALGMIWFPLWALLCYSNPEVHPFISETELNYLQKSSERLKNKKLPPPPWKHILISKQFWAFVIALIGCDWAYFTMASDLPKYMSNVVQFSIEDNGYLSSLPYLSMWLSSIFSCWLCDRVREKDWIALTNMRKIMASISLMGPGVFILAASYAECDQVLVVVMFILGMTLMGFSYPSIMINALDLSPNYAGTLMAIGNGIAALGGILTPYIVGVLTPNQTIGEWRLVFWIVFAVAVLSTTYFLIYATAKVQVWDDPVFPRDKKKINTKKTTDKVFDEGRV